MEFNLFGNSHHRDTMEEGCEDAFENSVESNEEDFELLSIPDVTRPVPSLIENLLIGQIKNNPIRENSTPQKDKENFLVKKSFSRRIFSSGQMGSGSTPNSKIPVDIFKRPIVPESDSENIFSTKRIKSISQGEFKPLPDGTDRTLRNCTNTNFPSQLKEFSEDDSSDTEVDMELDKSWECPSSHSNASSVKNFQKRSQSDSAVSIMKAVERIDSDSMLIGDASRRYILPIKQNGKHRDLKEISGETLKALMSGQYKDLIETFEIIDCRYPYEYEGGHIKGAINLHTQKQVHDIFLQDKQPLSLSPTQGQRAGQSGSGSGHSHGSTNNPRHILVFHCEFSSQRAPDLCRFLRKADRQCNLNSFPALHFPELYVLYGGYKLFFQLHQDLCEPQDYIEMTDPQHVQSCRWHKSKSKNDLVCTKSNSESNFAPKMQRKTTFKMFSL